MKSFSLPLRRVAQRLSRGRVFKRRLPPEFGRCEVFVSPESGLKYYRMNLRKADPLLFRMAQELVHEADVVWDIGANVGLFTFASAARAGRLGQVLAIEPDTWLVELLRRSASLPGARRSPVVVLPAAVSDTVGTAELQILSLRSSNFLASGGPTDAEPARRSEHVVTVTLDWLLERFPAPQVLKIDVEGLETAALKGGVQLLSRVRPLIWCEVWARNSLDVAHLLHAAGYELYEAALDPALRKPVSRAVYDTLAVPREQVSAA